MWGGLACVCVCGRVLGLYVCKCEVCAYELCMLMCLWKHGACVSVCLFLVVRWWCVDINRLSSLMHTTCTSSGMVGGCELVLVNVVHASYFNLCLPFGLYCTQIY